MKRRIMMAALLATTTSMLAGCGSPGTTRDKKLASNMAKARPALIETREEVASILANVDKLQTESTDPTTVYPEFRKQAESIAKRAEKLKKHRMAIAKSGKIKFDAWREELKTIRDETLRAQSLQRMQEALKAQEKTLASLKRTQTILDAFSIDLKDLVKYLDLDLSRKGIEAITSSFDKSRKDGLKLKQEIDGVLKTISKAQNVSIPQT